MNDDIDFAGDSSTTARLAIGSSISSVQQNTSDQDWIGFDAVAGQTIRFSVEGYVGVRIVDADVNVLAANVRGPQGFTANDVVFTAPGDGLFFVEVLALFTRRSAPRDYTITATEESGDDFADTIETAASLAVGTPLAGAIEIETDVDYYAIEVVAGSTYSITTAGAGQIEQSNATSLDSGSVILPDGTEIELDAGEFTATETGVVFVKIEGARSSPFGARQTGEYEVTVREVLDYTIIDGTPGDDTIIGTSATDDILGFAGNDLIQGLAGNDILRGNTGDDRIEGGAGDDDLYGGNDNDRLIGGTGDDYLNGGRGDDLMEGGDGADGLFGAAGNDDMRGGAGDDFLAGGAGDDQLFGQDGVDTLRGGAGNDSLSAGSEVDQEFGDNLFGDGGNDALFRSGAGDYMRGGADDDELFGNGGDDLMSGDGGNDRLDGGLGDDIMRGGAGDDQLFGADGYDRLFGGDGIDDLFGGQGDDRLWGGEGNDNVSGNEGNDILKGGAGNDYMDGGAGRDVIWGGEGADTFAFREGSGRDIVRDFDVAEDMLALDSLSGSTTFKLSFASQIGDNTVFNFGNGDVLVLVGVDLDTLSDANFEDAGF